MQYVCVCIYVVVCTHTPTEAEPDSPFRKGKNKIKPFTVDRISAKQFSITSHVTTAQRNNNYGLVHNIQIQLPITVWPKQSNNNTPRNCSCVGIYCTHTEAQTYVYMFFLHMYVQGVWLYFYAYDCTSKYTHTHVYLILHVCMYARMYISHLLKQKARLVALPRLHTHAQIFVCVTYD